MVEKRTGQPQVGPGFAEGQRERPGSHGMALGGENYGKLFSPAVRTAPNLSALWDANGYT